MPDLFDHALQERMQSEAPLATRMRPRKLEELKADFRDFENLGSLFMRNTV